MYQEINMGAQIYWSMHNMLYIEGLYFLDYWKVSSKPAKIFVSTIFKKK